MSTLTNQSILKALAITIIIILSTTASLLWFTWLAVQFCNAYSTYKI